nr:MAG TPA: hypothetical protein [Caudoviricetes sp.]DAS90661.1 MAG TPA: hypothetical protein [Caudoviricetes sp.]
MLYFDESQADCKPSQRDTLVGAFFVSTPHARDKRKTTLDKRNQEVMNICAISFERT